MSCAAMYGTTDTPGKTPKQATDWPQIVRLYDDLLRVAPSPVVRLNRAVAVAMADGPAVGLALVEELSESGELAGYHLLPATRASHGATVSSRRSVPDTVSPSIHAPHTAMNSFLSDVDGGWEFAAR